MTPPTDERVSEERLRNHRAWAADRVGSLSGADITVAAIDELLATRQALREVLPDLADIAITAEQREKYYQYGKYMQHEPDCLPPRGDQQCKCGRNQIYCNVDIALDEVTDSVPYNKAYVSPLRKALTKLSALAGEKGA
jgi:hypothetical protein